MAGPWEDGPKELLQHAIDHLNAGGDFDRRIAMISTDNAVEIMMKTYLSMPKRVRGTLGPSRKEIDEAKNSFPAVLDLVEKYGGEKLTGIGLDEIEWYHRIRNEIYHSGQGVTVEIARVETYLQLAILLFENLFGTKLRLTSVNLKQQKVGKYLALWNKAQSTFFIKRPDKPKGEYAYYWNRKCLERLSPKALDLWEKLENFRNYMIHDLEVVSSTELDKATEEAQEFLEYIGKMNN